MLRELEEAVQRQFLVSDAAAPTTTGVAKDWESRLHISQVRTILEYNVIRRSLWLLRCLKPGSHMPPMHL